MHSWTIGAMTVTRIDEMAVRRGLLADLIPRATSAAVRDIPWLAPVYADADGLLRFHSHAFVIETGDATVVVDTCVGNDKTVPLLPEWQQLDTDFLQNFADAGFSPSDIDYVVCTHLHFDHVGWNTTLVDGSWVPTFPNARYIVEKEDHDELVRTAAGHQEVGSTPISPTTRCLLEESIEPVASAGLVDLVEATHEIVAGVRLIPTPGHTKGHVAVRITSGDGDAVIVGDLFHHPAQVARPAWISAGDYDPAQTEESRAALLASVVDTATILLGAHWPGASAGHVTGDGDDFRLVP